MSGGEKAQKLVDLSNFSIYFDSELLGDLEGQALVVRVSKDQSIIYHAYFLPMDLLNVLKESEILFLFSLFSSRMPCC